MFPHRPALPSCLCSLLLSILPPFLIPSMPSPPLPPSLTHGASSLPLDSPPGLCAGRLNTHSLCLVRGSSLTALSSTCRAPSQSPLSPWIRNSRWYMPARRPRSSSSPPSPSSSMYTHAHAHTHAHTHTHTKHSFSYLERTCNTRSIKTQTSLLKPACAELVMKINTRFGDGRRGNPALRLSQLEGKEEEEKRRRVCYISTLAWYIGNTRRREGGSPEIKREFMVIHCNTIMTFILLPRVCLE